MKAEIICTGTRGQTSPKVFTQGAIVMIALLVTGCGTTSNFKPNAAKSTVDLSRFDKLNVEDFADDASQKTSPSKREKKQSEMNRVTHDFADMVAWEVGHHCKFEEVLRNATNDNRTLIIGGRITRYEEGSATARLLVGMGAGSSYFDAEVQFRDGGSGEVLGKINSDQYSWVLGGGMAAGQTPDGFMRQAARKVAEEICRLKGVQPPQSISAQK